MEVKVSKGQSLWKIAKANKPEGVTTAEYVQQIIDANSFDDPDELQIGDVVTLPGKEDVPSPRPRPDPKSAPAADSAPRQELDGGSIDALPRTEVLAPAGSAFDRESAILHARQKEELARRASLHTARRLSEGKGKGATKSMFDDRPGEVILDQPLPPPRPAYVAQATALPSAPDRHEYTFGDPGGLVEEGNINIAQRKRVDNGDGTFSTVKSKSFEEDGVEVLIPTMDPDGNDLSDDDALKLYEETGQHLGKFRSPDQATAYAQRLSLSLGGPTHDPDAFIDLNSQRWRDVFGGDSGMYEARKVIQQNKGKRSAQGAKPPLAPQANVPTPRPKPKRSRPTPKPEAIQALRDMLTAGQNTGVIQPTRPTNGK